MYFLKRNQYMNLLPSFTGGGSGGGGGAAENEVTIGKIDNQGTNSVGISSPHIVQYPRPPKRDDGRWIALSSVIGNIIGKLSSQKVVKEARDAENKWREVMQKLRDISDGELARVPKLRDKASDAMDDLDKRNVLNWGRGDLEYSYGEQLKPCIDNMADEVCALSDCGYTPDYDGIYSRVSADAALAEQKEFEKLCRVNNRYNTGWNCDVRGQLAIATQNAIIANTNKLREEERLNKWKYDSELKLKTLNNLETIRQGRQSTAQSYDKTASAVRAAQYTAYTSDAQKSLEMGAQMLAAYGQNAAWLAESLRKTAKESMADWGTLATMIMGLMFAWNAKESAAKANDCGGGSDGNTLSDFVSGVLGKAGSALGI